MKDIFRKITLSKGIGDVWVELEIDIDKDFKPSFWNIGQVKVGSVYRDNTEECIWDNLDFFFTASKKDIKEECKKELEFKNLYIPGIFKTIRELTKEARKLGLYYEQGSK